MSEVSTSLCLCSHLSESAHNGSHDWMVNFVVCFSFGKKLLV